MPLLLVLLFIVVPIAELALLIQVGQWIGVWWTVGLLVLDALLGSWLLRHEGRVAWRRFNEALVEGRVPHREVIDGVLVIFGGAFLLTPGFCSDVVGALLLLPPTRAVIRRVLARRFTFRMLSDIPSPGMPRRRPGRGDAGQDYDVEGTASDIDPRRLP